MRGYAVSVKYGSVPRMLRDQPTQVVVTAQRAAVGATLPYLQRRLALATPVGATTIARGSVVPEMRFGQPVAGWVGYSAPASGYIGFVNRGTRPHFPPIEALAYWAARKFGYPVGSPEARRIGYLVARRISRFGTKGQHFVERVVAAERGTVVRMARQAAIDSILQMRRG